jgi:mono/diheme cytochrome c family protein
MAVFVAFVALGMCAGAKASEPAAVFTERQASAGRAAFGERCASCHMPDLSGSNDVPPLAGKIFVGAWRTRTTKELIDYMSAAMPPGGPALPLETYVSIGAFVLKSNGAAAGAHALTASTVAAIGDLIAAGG